jgi:hypothetical protein
MFQTSYVTGLVDGEGSFTVYVRNPEENKKVSRRVKVEPRFYVKLVEQDKVVLFKLQKFFGCGNVYFQGDKRENHQQCYRFEVANRNDLSERIIPFFRKNELQFPSKKKDFKIFCRLMKMIERKEHLSPSGLMRIYDLKQHMH